MIRSEEIILRKKYTLNPFPIPEHLKPHPAFSVLKKVPPNILKNPSRYFIPYTVCTVICLMKIMTVPKE
jgi:hypothetical protein